MYTLTLCKDNRFQQRTNLLSEAPQCMVFWWQQIYRFIRPFTASPHNEFSETLTLSELSFKSTTKVYSIYSKPSARWGKSMKALKATGEIQGKLAEMMFLSGWKGCWKMRAGLWTASTGFWVWWSLCEEKGDLTCPTQLFTTEKEGLKFKNSDCFLMSSELRKPCMVFTASRKWRWSMLNIAVLEKNGSL